MADARENISTGVSATDSSIVIEPKHTRTNATAPQQHDEASPSPSERSPRAILTCIGAFFALFTTVGLTNAWGIFQDYYHRNQLSQYSESEISWIGSFSAFAIFMAAAPAGLLSDKMGPRPLLASGSIGLLMGVMMTSLCTQYYQFFLAQGLMTGTSMAFLAIPAMATVSRHFVKHRGLATGFTIAGSSTGGIVWPIMLDRLLNANSVSFGWTMRAVGFVMIFPTLLAVLLVRAPLTASQSSGGAIEKGQHNPHDNAPSPKKKLDFSITRNTTYILFCSGTAVYNLAMFVPFFFLTSYAASIGMSTSLSFYLLSVLNGASLFGRIIMGILADKYGAFNLTSIVALVGAMIAFCWTTASSVGGLVVWAIAYGFSSGAILSLQLPCAAQLATPETYGTAMGLALGLVSITNLVGSPICGELIPHGYLPVSMFAGASMVAGGVLLVLARLHQNRQLFVKV